jgi:hypothetical protein
MALVYLNVRVIQGAGITGTLRVSETVERDKGGVVNEYE